MTELLTTPAHGQLAALARRGGGGRPELDTGRASAPRRTDRPRARPLATAGPPRPARALLGAAPPAGAARRLAPLLARGAGDRAPRPRSLGGGAVRLRRARSSRTCSGSTRRSSLGTARRRLRCRNEPGLRRRPRSRRAAISARSRRPRSTSTPRRSAAWATTSSAAAACDAVQRTYDDGALEP